MQPENGELLAAVSAGIEEANGPAPEPVEPEGDEADDTPPEGDEPEGDEPSTDPADIEAATAVDGEPTDDKGKPAADDDKTKPKPKPGEVKLDEPKKPDPINDPMPNALKRETKERIQTLVSWVKERDAKLAELSTQVQAASRERDELVGYITETKATPEQFNQALEYLSMVNSGDPVRIKQALVFMQAEVDALARMAGVAVPGVDMLRGNDDLIAEVNAGRLSLERANEIAAARASQEFNQRAAQAAQHRQQTQTQQQQAIQTARSELSALGQQLEATDPVGYAAKKDILVRSLKPVFANIPPSQWAATFKRAYDALPAPAAAPAPLGAPTPPVPAARRGGNTPLRANNPAGGAAPAPKSLLEAVSLGISNAG